MSILRSTPGGDAAGGPPPGTVHEVDAEEVGLLSARPLPRLGGDAVGGDAERGAHVADELEVPLLEGFEWSSAWRLEHAAFGALERALDFGFGWDEYWKFAFGAVVVLWGVFTPILRMRSVHKSKEA